MADSITTQFTPSEIKFLLAVLSNVEGGTLKFNKQAVADQLGMKDTASVTARWNTICRTKINKSGDKATAGEAGGAGKKRKVKEEDDDPTALAAGDAKKKRTKKTAKVQKKDEPEDPPRWDTPGSEDGSVVKDELFE